MHRQPVLAPFSAHYYSFLFGEIKGPLGSAGEARLQNVIAMHVGLCLILSLARQARSADPNSYRPPSDTMRRLYGIQSGFGGHMWKLECMTAVVGKEREREREREQRGSEDSAAAAATVDDELSFPHYVRFSDPPAGPKC